MAALLICGLCETTLHTGAEGRGVVIDICEKCKLSLRAEVKRPIFKEPKYGTRFKAA